MTAEVDPEVGTIGADLVPRWNGTSLASGSIFDDGVQVGVGTTAPAANVAMDVVRTLAGDATGLGKSLLHLATTYTGGGGSSNVGPLYGLRIAEEGRILRENGSALRATGGFVGGGHDLAYTADFGLANPGFNGGSIYALSGGVTIAATNPTYGDRAWGLSAGVGTSGTQSLGSPSGLTDEVYGVRAGISGDYTAADPNYRLAAVYGSDATTGTATSFAGYFAGDVQITGTMTAAACTCPSDRRLKEKIEPIEGALDKVLHLRGVTFDWRHDEKSELRLPEGRQVGLVAQEVEEVVPEVVATTGDGIKTLQLANLTAVLIEAVKDQQQQIDTLRRQLQAVQTADTRP